jgi:hypothetical protein
MESSINVSVRLKPLTQTEKEDERNKEWKEMHGDTITLSSERLQESFSFDHVFSADK